MLWSRDLNLGAKWYVILTRPQLLSYLHMYNEGERGGGREGGRRREGGGGRGEGGGERGGGEGRGEGGGRGGQLNALQA